ncbi:hypothetical protein [uncultured Kriegella sp.]|uniref:hypothetical protein n=1 Tax=uncultured Kriegella sp. TaxID=1798910 RepID=UPI0030DD43F7|tara:strand:- start:440303 stop:440746 length:444 start_codon:yes stop_codon:yes gene_type:complete
MESDNIEELLEKYFEATATGAEEEALRRYYQKGNVAPHLEKYAPMFQYVSLAKKERYTRQVSLPISGKSRKNIYKWFSVAAVVALCFGLYLKERAIVTLESEYTQEEIASAQEALALFTHNFSKGTKQLSYLEEFERNTNKFLIKEQ